MPAIELKLEKTPVGSAAHFTGVVEPVGSSGYKFSGTLKGTCALNREKEIFVNTVRIGHGGVSGKYTHLDFPLKGGSENTFKVEGEGERAPNEKVEFYVGVNEGLSGQFEEGPETICDLGVISGASENGQKKSQQDKLIKQEGVFFKKLLADFDVETYDREFFKQEFTRLNFSEEKIKKLNLSKGETNKLNEILGKKI